MNKSESKYFRTAKRMDDALVELLNEKPFEYITVKEICAKAGVNRSTFYLHYETVGDLLNETIDGTMRDFYARFSGIEANFKARIKTCPLDELVLITPEYLDAYLTYIRENRRVFSCMALVRPTGVDTERLFRQLYEMVFSPILSRFQIDEEERRYMMLFYLNGIMAIIREWIAGDCDKSNNEISAIILRCVRPYIDDEAYQENTAY